MKKTRRELILEELELARQGKLVYKPDPDYVIIRDPKKHQKLVDEICRLNGLPVVKKATSKRIPVSDSLHRRIEKPGRKKKNARLPHA